jgi:Leucine-rich repeat (LRR) protein
VNRLKIISIALLMPSVSIDAFCADSKNNDAATNTNMANQYDASELNLDGIAKWPTNIKQPEKVLAVNIDRGQLKSIPADIAILTNLNTLSVARIGVVSLPPEIKALKKLETLYMTKTDITTLPTEVGELTNLKTLDVSYSSAFNTLPASIGNLSNLTELGLSGTALSALPAEIGQLANLERCIHEQNYGATARNNSVEKFEVLRCIRESTIGSQQRG